MAATPKTSEWKNQKVLVTGCNGFLGSWLTQSLVNAGAEVTGLIRDVLPRSNFVRLGLSDQIQSVYGSLEDYWTLERILNEFEIDTVFHLAAQTQVTFANRNPIATFDSNIKGTWNLLEACRRSPWVKRIIVASSDKAYGDHPILPYSEEAPLRGEHPYDVSKSCADLIALSYFKTYQLPVCITRCGNLYGGGDLNFNRIVPGSIRSAFLNEPPIIRSDGKFIRDYVFVQEAVDAYLLLASKMNELGLRGEAFNFNGETLNTLDITNRILERMGKKDLKPIILNQASGEIRDQSLLAKKAEKMLGWKRRYSIEEGLDQTIAWYREFLKADSKVPAASS